MHPSGELIGKLIGIRRIRAENVVHFGLESLLRLRRWRSFGEVHPSLHIIVKVMARIYAQRRSESGQALAEFALAALVQKPWVGCFRASANSPRIGFERGDRRFELLDEKLSPNDDSPGIFSHSARRRRDGLPAADPASRDRRCRALIGYAGSWTDREHRTGNYIDRADRESSRCRGRTTACNPGSSARAPPANESRPHHRWLRSAADHRRCRRCRRSRSARRTSGWPCSRSHRPL